jgi:hypothetical protein
MSIKAHTPAVTVKFGKTAKIGVIIGKNVESRRPVLVLAPIQKSERGKPFDPEKLKDGETRVILEFVSPKSIDVVIGQLEKVKQILIEDYTAKLGAELHNKLDEFINGEN